MVGSQSASLAALPVFGLRGFLYNNATWLCGKTLHTNSLLSFGTRRVGTPASSGFDRGRTAGSVPRTLWKLLGRHAKLQPVGQRIVRRGIPLRGGSRAGDRLRSLLARRHPLCPASEPESLAEACCRRELPAHLVSDDQTVSEHAAAETFFQHPVISDDAIAAADSIEQTQLARLTGAAIDVLKSAVDASLVWIHSRGMTAPWDAPRELREALVDEVDPAAPDFVAVPGGQLTVDDPDEVWSLAIAYSAQVKLVDMCVGAILAAIESLPVEQTMLIVSAPRGFMLGRHQTVGYLSDRLLGSQLHVPLFCRTPLTCRQPERRAVITQPMDIFATVADWLALDLPRTGLGAWSLLADFHPMRVHFQQAVSISSSHASIRTPEWFMRIPEPAGDRSTAQLYVKPDDRWEMNEIAARCPEIIPELCDAITTFRQAAEHEAIDRLERR